MIPNISEKINDYLKKNNLVALFPFVPHKKTVYRKDFVISWTHNYTTLVTRDNCEYFLKVALEPEKFDDLERQVDFYQLLEEQKHLTFKTPKLYEWNTSGDFYFYLREKMNGDLLGNCVRAKKEFATKHIFEQLNAGFKEVNELSMIDKTYWQKTKDPDWIKEKITRTDENEKIKTILGPDLWQQIKTKILNTKYQILDTKPLWGDPGPNNFLVEHGQLAIIDYAPFTYGYKYADFAEFASFCVFSNEWNQFVEHVTNSSRSEIVGNHIFNAFLMIFLIDRAASVLWLESQGQLKVQLKKPKEIYLETLKKEIVTLLHD